MSTPRKIINVVADGILNETSYVVKVTYDGILTPFRVVVRGSTIPTNYSTLVAEVTRNRATPMVEGSIDGCVWERDEHLNYPNNFFSEIIL